MVIGSDPSLEWGTPSRCRLAPAFSSPGHYAGIGRSGKGSWEQGRGGDGDRSAISPENDTRPGLATSSRAKSGSGAESNN